ncbi:MAG TPA: winged helix-turn-helix domain-containing protein [Pyrinomonadaceae bacterium]|nr:winged helix-turn-helix domain-containing protein [Pyrinomonadaceae bacterium]
MGVPEGFEGLRFPCECVSSRRGGYSEPWAAVAKHKLLPNGTKEEILNLVAQEPMTISQLAAALGLSAPSVHTHVTDMLKSELLRHAAEWERAHPAERYYEPNFPVIKADEAAELCQLCDELAEKVAALFKRHRRRLEKVFGETPLAERGWDLAEVAQYVFASVQRGARERLEREGVLSPPKAHRNGAEWVFWAEQPRADEDA